MYIDVNHAAELLQNALNVIEDLHQWKPELETGADETIEGIQINIVNLERSLEILQQAINDNPTKTTEA